LTSLINNFEWQPSVIDKDLTAPPGGESTGDRYLIGLDTGASSATGAWAGQDGNIAEWNGSSWDFTTPTTGMYVAADDENDRLYLFGGVTWSDKVFESTTASTGLTKVGFDIRLDASSAGDGIAFAAGVYSLDLVAAGGLEISSNQLQVKLDGGTLSLSASGLKVADGGIADAQINASAAIATSKLADSAELSEAVTFFGATDISGAEAETLTDGSNADSLHEHSVLKETRVAGEAMAATTSFLVRNAVSGETAGQMHKADQDVSSSFVHEVVGIAKIASAVVQGNNIEVFYHGPYTLAASDTPFGAGDIGKPVYLGSAGGFTVTPPSANDTAVVVVGKVRTTTIIDVNIDANAPIN